MQPEPWISSREKPQKPGNLGKRVILWTSSELPRERRINRGYRNRGRHVEAGSKDGRCHRLIYPNYEGTWNVHENG
jgi:hypothetical protein